MPVIFSGVVVAEQRNRALLTPFVSRGGDNTIILRMAVENVDSYDGCIYSSCPSELRR